MKRSIATLAAFIVLLTAVHAGAQDDRKAALSGSSLLARVDQARESNRRRYYSGEELLEMCESELIAKQNACTGYTTAVLDTHEALVASSRLERGFCVPKGVDPVQLVRVAVKHLTAEPDKLHGSAASLLLNYLAQAFPCE